MCLPSLGHSSIQLLRRSPLISSVGTPPYTPFGSDTNSRVTNSAVVYTVSIQRKRAIDRDFEAWPIRVNQNLNWIVDQQPKFTRELTLLCVQIFNCVKMFPRGNILAKEFIACLILCFESVLWCPPPRPVEGRILQVVGGMYDGVGARERGDSMLTREY